MTAFATTVKTVEKTSTSFGTWKQTEFNLTVYSTLQALQLISHTDSYTHTHTATLTQVQMKLIGMRIANGDDNEPSQQRRNKKNKFTLSNKTQATGDK